MNLLDVPKICGSGWNLIVVPRRLLTRPTFSSDEVDLPRD
jgi:hypothetical protein